VCVCIEKTRITYIHVHYKRKIIKELLIYITYKKNFNGMKKIKLKTHTIRKKDIYETGRVLV